MRPIVTLLTDFGLADSYVAEMKAAILSEATDIRLVDISHQVPPGDIRAAQYLLGRAWRRFPVGTVHVVVVDPGVGSARRAIALHHQGHFFTGPDNGVLTSVLNEAEVVELRIPRDASPTFQGRDVFAPAAARLAEEEPLAGLGPSLSHPVRLPVPTPRRENGVVEGEVIYVDRFGTLIANIPGDWVQGAKAIEVSGKPVGAPRRTFADVESGAFVGFVGSDGLLEIAVRDGSAARRLGVGVGAEVRVR
ncbi:MAG: SAM-dependent chlorinase/fluorinase [Gemmatimonadetes bacterium]|nr:SAM-dependent chlorinase/fluorinase [Gemmatimonadota bacterium]MBI2402274.1 SAM-dependent chlorinase/fluorinase [Gemmatimonadota bacterium]